MLEGLHKSAPAPLMYLLPAWSQPRSCGTSPGLPPPRLSPRCVLAAIWLMRNRIPDPIPVSASHDSVWGDCLGLRALGGDPRKYQIVGTLDQAVKETHKACFHLTRTWTWTLKASEHAWDVSPAPRVTELGSSAVHGLWLQALSLFTVCDCRHSQEGQIPWHLRPSPSAGRQGSGG